MIESTNQIFRGDGVRSDRVVRRPYDFPIEPVRLRTIADLVPVADVMTRGVKCAARDLRRDALVQLMVKNRIGCVPVVDDTGFPIGMVTKLDLVEQLLMMDPPADRKTAHELMMPIALTLGEHTTVAQAAALMAREDIHHVPIVDEEANLIGILTSMDIVSWLADNDGVSAPPP